MGVKSLWNLLEPVGRPVLLETMEGKAMAIDSSIWIYQFQATMRDKEGRALVNAHVVGFLRRISKLLFYGIKPVFVFDGGAPVLKKATIAERKTKKSGAAESHARIAERLLAAQMRREALTHAQMQSNQVQKSKSGVPTGPVVIDENTVYLEDIEGNGSRTPVKKTPTKEPQESPPSGKKSRWHDHDPYRLPDVNLDDVVAKATHGSAPDPRLATEDELRAFIEEMRPEDFDVTSTAFRELPTEVQYEIIGDLRLKSRQTSYKRLQNMLKNAKTPLDFSKEQIKNLKQRNALTQQLLTTTDSIGKAHVEIPIRIASERNKQYLLIKNEGEEGGWILGVRDEGSRSKPIEIDQEPKPAQKRPDDEDSDMDMEEVDIAAPPVDPDLREYRRTQALTALADRYSPKKLAPLNRKPVSRRKVKPLFVPEVAEIEQAGDEEFDPEMSFAIQESLEYEEESNLRRAIEESKAEANAARDRLFGSNVGASTSRSTLDGVMPATPRRGSALNPLPVQSDSDDDLYASPTRLETALSIANAISKRTPVHATKPLPPSPESAFGRPVLLMADAPIASQREPTTSDRDEELVAIPASPPSEVPPVTGAEAAEASDFQVAVSVSGSDEDMEPVIAIDSLPLSVNDIGPSSPPPLSSLEEMTRATSPVELDQPVGVDSTGSTPAPSRATAMAVDSEATSLSTMIRSPVKPPEAKDRHVVSSDSESEGDWSRAASPAVDGERVGRQVETHEDWDAAQEIDPQAEEGEFAQFLSQVKGKNLDEVRREIDEEIRALNQQKKVAMRDSEDITQQMVSQIMMMLRLFGIPYITAPMEAEAQCAELLTLGLVDGIITDDSDVFLFGGARILRNMFNQSKTVECFLSSDLERELGLDREKLVRLAYLLGSDYTEGLPGVGPVVAMELLTEFPGTDGLHRFRDWWRKVQSGRDTAGDSKSKFRKRFKKRFKDLFLADDWPNPAVRDAYYHPTVDSSEEPFKWGLPDLDALRGFLNSELGWNQEKVDDLLLPIIRKMGKRNQAGSANKQGNLTSFFDVPAGGGAPRKRQAYASRRLQQVVADFRKQQAASAASTPQPSRDNSDESEYEEQAKKRPPKRRKTTKNGTSVRGSGRGRGRGARGGRSRGKGRAERDKSISVSSSEEEPLRKDRTTESASPEVNSRPRPKPRPVYKGAEPTAPEEAEE